MASQSYIPRQDISDFQQKHIFYKTHYKGKKINKLLRTTAKSNQIMTFHKEIKVVCVTTIPFFNALGLKNQFKYLGETASSLKLKDLYTLNRSTEKMIMH